MSEKERHSVSEELLFRYFVQEVNPKEQELVVSWKSDSEENRQEFERLKTFFLDVKAVNSIGNTVVEYDINKAWESAKGNMKPKSTDSIQGRYSWMKVAAAILLMIGAGWFVYFSNNVETMELATADLQQSIQLVDGSTISLNKGSQLIYPSKFKGDKRKVELKGEAYFEVAHNPDQPFLIETSEVEVQVLGTTFNVDNSNADSIVVTVDTGKVLMSVGGKEQTLTKGYKGIYYRNTQHLVKIETASVGMHNYWRTKMLTLKGATISEAILAIQEAYDVDVKLSNPDIANCRINVDFENEEIENVLNIIGATLDLVWSNQGDSYLLAGYGCPQ